MLKNDLPITALILITIGTVGIFSTTWFGGHSWFSGTMSSMMLGGGMMGRNQMREMMQGMMSGRLPPGIKPGDLPEPASSGAKALVRYCIQCHNLPSPAMHSAEEWPAVEARMFSRMEMMAGMRGKMGGMMMRETIDIQAPSKEEEVTILAYLQQHALHPAPLEKPGTPDTPGFRLFRQTCSQCHALPDPRLHTAEEWFGVVDRMRKNMEIMGKPTITDQERERIVSYLNQNAR